MGSWQEILYLFAIRVENRISFCSSGIQTRFLVFKGIQGKLTQAELGLLVMQIPFQWEKYYLKMVSLSSDNISQTLFQC